MTRSWRFYTAAFALTGILVRAGVALAQTTDRVESTALAVRQPAAAVTGVDMTKRLSLVESAAPQAGSADRRHKVGLGGRLGGFTLGVGASARYWSSDALGLQLDLSHYGVTGVGITQIAPSVLFVLGQPDLSQATQIRPYAGGGLNIMHTTLFDEGDTGIGGQGFVGVEAVFAGAPSFGVSADIGYYSTGTFFGVSVGGIGVSVAGHYYFR